MSLLAPLSGIQQIEDCIDLIGQKYRVKRILRGAMLWLASLVMASFAGALVAHLLGHGAWTIQVLVVWSAWVLTSTWFWVAAPLLIRPKPVEVARFVESRVKGLHDGLTNGLLLSRRTDLAESPWLAEIYNEIAAKAGREPLGEAVKLRELMPMGIILSCIVVPLVTTSLIFPKVFFQGWKQLLSPTVFVPKTGDAEIIDVLPGDVTAAVGQPLEITLLVKCAGRPTAKVIFEKTGGDSAALIPDTAELTGTAPALDSLPKKDQQANLQYTHRVDHVDAPMRYRVEVAGTQSQWYTVSVVRQIRLEQLEFEFHTPGYTGPAMKDLIVKATDVAKTNITVPQGTVITMTAQLDLPAAGAMLDMGANEPLQMTASANVRRFSVTFPVMNDMPIGVLISLSGRQIVARLPDEPLVVHCIPDQPPTADVKWPNVTMPLDAELKIHSLLSDDYGLTSARLLMAVDVPAAPPATQPAAAAGDNHPATLAVVHEEWFPAGTGVTARKDFTFVLPLKPEQRKAGTSIRVQVETTDNRDIRSAVSLLAASSAGRGQDAFPTDGGPQTHVESFTFTLEAPAAASSNSKDDGDSLRNELARMLKTQKVLQEQTLSAKLDDHRAFIAIGTGQIDLRRDMQTTAKSFPFKPVELIVQKVLLKLSFEEAKDAVDQAAALQTEPAADAQRKLGHKLRDSQRRIVDILETLLASLSLHPTTQPTTREGHDPLLSRAEAMKKLAENLKDYMKQEQKILDQTTSLAKKPVDNWDDADKKKLEELKMAQEKLDAFMQEKLHDFSKNSEQDMANSSLLAQLMEVYSETTMAKDALKQKAAELAVAAEENGIDNAKTLTSNIEKWLANAPDRTKWTQEDPLSKTDLNMPELPRQLEDLVGKLLEQQEDLFDEMEDANANWAGSFDKGIGWDAADGPIASMNAQGVTGNQLPNNNEMNGRSGEGRSGKSQGEFVEDHATGKGGRNTPTRLDPTPFQKGQVKDDSKDPTGGATGGGKMSGQGGQGLEGPVGPKQHQAMERLAEKQAQIRNAAERLNHDFHLGKYDNFRLEEAIALMRRVESDIHANRYKNALRVRDVTLDALDNSRMMLGGEVHVQRDTTPVAGKRLQEKINDAKKGELIPNWSDPLSVWYKKLGQN